MTKKSKQARKQRKKLFNLPLHKKRKQLSAHLSKELKEKHKKRAIPLRKGDTVKIVKGEFNKKSGKVTSVSLKKMKIQIEKIVKKKINGTEKAIWIEPSNVIIMELNLEDKKRNEILGRK